MVTETDTDTGATHSDTQVFFPLLQLLLLFLAVLDLIPFIVLVNHYAVAENTKRLVLCSHHFSYLFSFSCILVEKTVLNPANPQAV